MSERPPHDSIENELERTLAEDLDGVSPRRNLWPDIAAGIGLQQPRSRRRWLIPALGWTAALITPLVLVLLAAPLFGTFFAAPVPVALVEGGEGTPGSPPDFEVPVSLAEWAVTTDPSVGSGEVRFDVTNDGGTVHQLAIYRGGSLAGDSIIGGTLVARTGNIQAGGTDALQAALEPGDYWLVCPIPGHTAVGMNAQLTVDAF